MKKIFLLILFPLVGFCALALSLSCSTSTPTAASNFQNPVLTVVSINTPYTDTPTYTPTNIPTATSTPTNTFTPTPFETTVPWTGFSTPEAIAVYNNPTNGGVFVADTGHNQVDKYNFNGTLATAWGEGGKGKGKISFNQPLALAVDSAGYLYVVGGISGIAKYDSFGNSVTQFTNVTFTNPQGLALDTGGNLYVGDTSNNRIVKLDSTGALVAGFGSGGSVTIITAGPVIWAPHGVAVDNNGNVATAASDNNIHVYDPTGAFLTVIPGVSSTAFSNPQGVAFDSGNNLYVADTGYHQVEEFANYALNASPIDIFNGTGTLVSPTGVGVDLNGNIYVTDAGTGKVIQFTP